MRQLTFQDDQRFWFETLRDLGLAVHGGSDAGEVAAPGSQVTSGDHDGRHDAWPFTAKRLEAEARAARPLGRPADGPAAPVWTTDCTMDGPSSCTAAVPAVRPARHRLRRPVVPADGGRS
ncbi:hypothetical protein ACE1SV_74010 [Streptomyces sennicomposti]